jgi:asparagine synthase (glutamine-hydrolysing)
MCGITGFLYRSKRLNNAGLSQIVETMANRLRHRGPDAGGVWSDAETGVSLGHRRLSIIDLSAAGEQPMRSASGRYVISYNGEIYNFTSARERLESAAYPFAGHSDTEVLLAAIECWGLQRALESVHGMFAFALWDREKRELTLVRDRVGKKPLYYGWSGDAFLFSSELKALRAHPEFDAAIDRNALAQFIQYGWISEPLSIHRNIRKLPPGAFITVNARSSPWAPQVQKYWAANRVMETARRNLFQGSFEHASDQLERLLIEAVTERMVADVDLGALLSGGIDSSAVVGVMQKHSDRPVKTFCIGFDEKKYNEAEYAAAIARYLGTDHYEQYVTAAECLDVVDSLPKIYDEPFGDISQVPTFLVAKMASKQVKVVLSGDGGDETFSGYKHYPEGLAQWRWLKKIPHGLRVAAADTLAASGDRAWNYFRPADSETGRKLPAWQKFAGKLDRKTRSWRAASPQAVLANHFSRTHRPGAIVIGAAAGTSNMTAPENWAHDIDTLSEMLHFDYVGYMVGDILVKVDRATMAVGLEARCPILDNRISEFAWTLPNAFLMDQKGGKRILKNVLERYVPRRYTDRPKRGFGVPIDDWLRGALRGWVEELISIQKLKDYGYLDPQAVRRLWDQHLCGWRNHSNILWSLVMFQAWYQSLEQDLAP